jgi:hypothetical protein
METIKTIKRDPSYIEEGDSNNRPMDEWALELAENLYEEMLIEEEDRNKNIKHIQNDLSHKKVEQIGGLKNV